jgi:hypothetical protein
VTDVDRRNRTIAIRLLAVVVALFLLAIFGSLS